jgi:hypothetical protein
VSAGITVPAGADAADVSMALRPRGWSPYRLRLEAEQQSMLGSPLSSTGRQRRDRRPCTQPAVERLCSPLRIPICAAKDGHQ